MTKNHLTRDNALVMSSTMPSAKYSCSGSPLMFVKGRTAIDGLSGNERQQFSSRRRSRRVCAQPGKPAPGGQYSS